MEAIRSCHTLVPPCKSTAWHNPYDHIITFHFRENLHIIIIIISSSSSSSSSSIYRLRIRTSANV
jgi:hypothetical protein